MTGGAGLASGTTGLAPSARRLAGLALAAMVHIALLSLLMESSRTPALTDVAGPQQRATPQKAILWVLPPAPASPRRELPAPVIGPALAPPSGLAIRRAARPRQRSVPEPVQETQARAAVATADDPATTDREIDFSNPPVAPDQQLGATVLERAKLDVGKIDRELRKAYPEAAPTPLTNSKQAILERAMNAAHDAVPPKWYEAGKIIELTTGDGANKTRSYKIITALLTYCINVSPAGKRSYTSCPR